MPVQGRIEHVLTHISKVHPQIRAEYETAYCTFWEKTPYSLGAFAAAWQRQATSGWPRSAKPDGRIFSVRGRQWKTAAGRKARSQPPGKQVKQLHEMRMTRTQTARA